MSQTSFRREFDRLLIVLAVCLVAVAVVFGVDRAPKPARIIRVIVALCDNAHQGIVPVPAQLGDGDDLRNNLYWGAMYGVRTWFNRDSLWQKVQTVDSVSNEILQRVVYHRIVNDTSVYLVADAYRGRNIRTAVEDFLQLATRCASKSSIHLNDSTDLHIGEPNLIAYVGHDGLMDFSLPPIACPIVKSETSPDVMILACLSKAFFEPYIEVTHAKPVLWTTGLCAPEAYTLSAAIEGWLVSEPKEQIRTRAAQAYDKYQNCGLNAARRLWVCD